MLYKLQFLRSKMDVKLINKSLIYMVYLSIHFITKSKGVIWVSKGDEMLWMKLLRKDCV